MTLVVFSIGRNGERESERDRERERTFCRFVSVVCGVSRVNDFGLVEASRERGGEREVALCQFVSMLLLDLSVVYGVSIVWSC